MKQHVLFPAHWLLMVWAGVVGLALPGAAQTTAQVSDRPDVLVVVYQRPDIGDEVGITYAHLAPRAQVQGDLQALARASGWTMTQLHTSNGPPASPGRLRPMTSASFVAPNVIQNETHSLPVEVFVTAFRSYKRLNLIFITASDFQFQGLRQFADNNVKIKQEQHGSAYTYQIQILNSQFDRLNLTPTTPQGANARRRSPLVLFLGILGAAGVAGLLVYLFTARLTADAAKSGPKDDHKN